MWGERAWRLSGASAGAGAAAVMIAYGLLSMLYYNHASPSNIAPVPDAAHLLAPRDTLPSSSTSTNCKDLGLNEDKLIHEGQLYHTPRYDANATCRSKYELYHERCTRDVDITALGIAGDAPEGCKYLVWKAKDGMGNQLLSLVCAFIYSLLTQRAMLVATDSHIQSYFCNPFSLSSWLLPDDFPETRLRTGAKRVAVYLAETLAQTRDPTQNISITPKHLQVFIMCCDAMRDHPFFCPASQELFTSINWIFYHSHEHTLPALYLIPAFREKLNKWFPNHDAFMHTSRYLLHPDDEIWEHILKFYKLHMDGVQKQIGIQVRVWNQRYDLPVSRQILRCAVEQMLLPKPQQESTNQSLGTSVNVTAVTDARHNHPNISVLVASLRTEYRDDLALQYAGYDGKNKSLHVSVFTASAEGSQRTGNAAHDEAAIIDIWLLSFMHEMVITPFSTFGSVASGMAGIVPLLFNNYGKDKVNEAACARSNVAGPCFIVYPRKQACELDPPSFSILDPASMVPEVKYCRFNLGLGIESAFYIP